MIWDSLKVFSNVRSMQKVYADDYTDKLNRVTTVAILILTALLIYSNKFFGHQINCIDDQMRVTSVTLDYVNSLCLAKDTYTAVDFFGGNKPENTHQKISFYPWLFLIVCSFAVCFYLPYLLWKSFVKHNCYHHIPVDITSIVTNLNKSDAQNKENFGKSIKMSSQYLDRCFSVNNFNDGFPSEECIDAQFVLSIKHPKGYRDRRNRRTHMVYCPLIVKYLFVKLCYLAVSVGVFVMAAQLLQMKEAHSFYKFGFDAISKWLDNTEINSTNYLDSKYFPRVVFCDIHVRTDKKINNIHTYQYQCALPSNIFNEKIFIVLWAWFVVMIVCNTYSLFRWMVKYLFRKTIIKNILLWPYAYDHDIDLYIDSFVYEYLSNEGFLVLMLIKSNVQDWHLRMLIRDLWLAYMQRIKEPNSHKLHDTSSDNAKMFDITNINENASINSPISPNSTCRVPMRRDINNELTSTHNIPSSFYSNGNKLKTINDNDTQRDSFKSNQ
jgi:hypothetical protein